MYQSFTLLFYRILSHKSVTRKICVSRKISDFRVTNLKYLLIFASKPICKHKKPNLSVLIRVIHKHFLPN